MFRQILAMTIKDLKIIFKDTGGMTALFLMPALLMMMSNALDGISGSGAGKLTDVLVVNLDRGPIPAALVADLKSSSGLHVETTWDSLPLTRGRAEQLIVDQQRNLAIVIPADFSDTMQQAAFQSGRRNRRRSISSSNRPRPNKCTAR